MPRFTAVILAAGQGTRMRSQLPKMLHPLCGRALVAWPIAAARAAGADRVVVVDAAARALSGHLPQDVTIVVQPEPNGTGGAVRAAATEIRDDATVVVLPGDAPLISGASPGSTTTVASWPICAAAARTAPPVPFGSGCTTIVTSSGR